MTYASKFLGLRDCCQTAKVFLSEEERAEWESGPHPHGDEGDTNE